MTRAKRIGVVGARGHVGRELLKLLENDPGCSVAFVASKGAAGQRADAAIGATGRFADLILEDVQPSELSKKSGKYCDLDGVVLGLGNGQSAPWVEALPAHIPLIDLSADHRFDDDGPFIYGLTEKHRERLRGATRVANPGCYATAIQLALWPFEQAIQQVQVFGVSGYSGAGSTPSTKNNLAILQDNLLAYDLVGHTQERELCRHSGLDVRFMPHVAPFFRGITCTISVDLKDAITVDDALGTLRAAYRDEPLITIVDGDMPPLVSDVREKNGVIIGGIEADRANKRLVIVAVIDNLLKGAATQALQNLHLALGVDEFSGITP